MGNWGYNLFKLSYGPLLMTGIGPNLYPAPQNKEMWGRGEIHGVQSDEKLHTNEDLWEQNQ